MIKEITDINLGFNDFSEEMKRQVEEDGAAIVLVFGEDGRQHMVIAHKDSHIGLEIDCFQDSIGLITEIIKEGFIKIAHTVKYKSDLEVEMAIDSGVYQLPLLVLPVVH